MNHSTKRPTAIEQARLTALHTLPCLCCVREIDDAIRDHKPVPIQPFVTQAHHLVDKGYRKHSGGHSATINICEWHHQGRCMVGFTAGQMQRIYGPSLALTKRAFVAKYGTERSLLTAADALLLSYQYE